MISPHPLLCCFFLSYWPCIGCCRRAGAGYCCWPQASGFTLWAVRRHFRCWRVSRWEPMQRHWASQKAKHRRPKSSGLTCAAVLCIGCLCLFQIAGVFRTDVPLLLPAGISFYTFQTLSYVIDIYRGRLMPERHPGYYALFVSFFPQLVAGPIERSTALLPQLHAQERRMDSRGWLWMVRGFAKKLLLADTAAVFVDSVYASPTDVPGPAVLLATLLFAGQIYWDFSGYSDIAVGAAALLGVR